MGRAARRKHEAPPAAAAAARPPAPAPRRAPAARGELPGWLRAAIGPACVVALGWLLYANSFAIPFLFDDYFEIQANPTVQQLAPLPSYFTRLRGLTALTFALNVRQGGLNPWGFHLVNVAVHLANALLVYALVLWTLRLPVFGGRYVPRARLLATLVALVFVAHPLQTMAASYIVQRAESLSSFFYLSTLLCAALALTAAGGRRAGLLAVALLAAVLGVLSKEIAVSVPAAAALYWFCFLRGEGRGSWRRWLPVLVLLIVPLAVGLLLARDYLLPADAPAGPLAGPRAWLFIPTAGFGVEGIGPWQYLLTQFGVVTWYLRLFLVPTRQVFDYGWPFADSLWRADVLLPLAALLALVAAAVLAYRRYRLATFCLGWVFITLAPTSSVIPLRDAAFEHRMYLPIIGLAWLLVVGGADLLAAQAARRGRSPRAAWRAATVALGLWIAFLGIATVRRNAVFADPFAFAEDNAAKAPRNWRAQYQLGEALQQRGRADDAIGAYEEAIRLNPDQGSARVALGSLYVQRRRYDDAERVLEPATRHPEESVVAAAQQNLAVVYQARGDLGGAEQALRRSLALKPQWTSAQRQLAGVYARQGQWTQAARVYATVLHAEPRLRGQLAGPASIASFRAGVELAGRRRFAEARALLQRALDYDPSLWRAHGYIAYIAASTGDWTSAAAELEYVERHHPGEPWTAAALERVRGLQRIDPPPAG